MATMWVKIKNKTDFPRCVNVKAVFNMRENCVPVPVQKLVKNPLRTAPALTQQKNSKTAR